MLKKLYTKSVTLKLKFKKKKIKKLQITKRVIKI